jgi:hypothetical protein
MLALIGPSPAPAKIHPRGRTPKAAAPKADEYVLSLLSCCDLTATCFVYLRAMGRYRELYPQFFALLPDNVADTIEFMITNNVITNNVTWGWEPEPSEEDIRDLCIAAARLIITEEQLDSLLAELNA